MKTTRMLKTTVGIIFRHLLRLCKDKSTGCLERIDSRLQSFQVIIYSILRKCFLLLPFNHIISISQQTYSSRRINRCIAIQQTFCFRKQCLQRSQITLFTVLISIIYIINIQCQSCNFRSCQSSSIHSDICHLGVLQISIPRKWRTTYPHIIRFVIGKKGCSRCCACRAYLLPIYI